MLGRHDRGRRAAARPPAVRQRRPRRARPPRSLQLAERLPSRLVIELTEQDACRTSAAIRERLRPWIARGALIAVDDAGAGFTSLEYVAEIRPDFLKLCRGMVTGVDLDDSPPGRPARHRGLRPRGRRPRGRRGRRAAARSSPSCAPPRSTSARAGCSAARGSPGRPSPRAAAAACAAAPAGGPARARGRLRRDGARRLPVVVEHLARTGLMPSVYLEQGGRLRCQAVRGYWQVCDGMPADAGVIGDDLPHGHDRASSRTSPAPRGASPSVPSVVAERAPRCASAAASSAC